MILKHRRASITTTLLAAWLAAASACDRAMAQASRPGADGPPLKWEHLGASTGRPLVFLPALGFPGRYWEKVYSAFESTNPVYVVTFAGSGGVPACQPPYFGRTIEAVHELIASQGLKDPVLVGHFFSIDVSLHVAAQYPDEVAGIFGIPFALPRVRRTERQEAARSITEEYLHGGPELWMPKMIQQIRNVVKNGEIVDRLVEMIKDADRETYARTLGELTADPIENDLPKVRCPVNFIAPVTLPPRAKRDSIEKAQERLAALGEERTDMIRMAYPNLAKCEAFALRNAGAFPMLDSPGRVVISLQRFLKRLDNPKSNWDSTIGAGAATQPTNRRDAP